jgi:hypothetical protein
MSTTPQEQIMLHTLVGWLQAVQVADGYHTNAGSSVWTDEIHLPDDPADAAPGFLLLDEATDSPGREFTMSLTLEAMVAIDGVPDGPRAEVRRLVQDARQAILAGANAARPLPGSIKTARVVRHETPRREPGSNYLASILKLEVLYYAIGA